MDKRDKQVEHLARWLQAGSGVATCGIPVLGNHPQLSRYIWNRPPSPHTHTILIYWQGLRGFNSERINKKATLGNTLMPTWVLPMPESEATTHVPLGTCYHQQRRSSTRGFLSNVTDQSEHLHGHVLFDPTAFLPFCARLSGSLYYS